MAAITLAPRASVAVVRPAATPLLGLDVSVAEPRALRGLALQLFGRSFAVTCVLEAVAILVGLAGVAATMSAQTIALRQEFGMLRHLGLAKRQVVAMLGAEGALLGMIGRIAGAGRGALLGQVLIHVINPQSFNWTMTTLGPLGTIAGVIAALVGAAALIAMLAGRRATSADAIAAVREDGAAERGRRCRGFFWRGDPRTRGPSGRLMRGEWLSGSRQSRNPHQPSRRRRRPASRPL